MTTAYRMTLRGGTLDTQRTTYPLAECDRPDAAVAKLRAGETVTVAGRDAVAVREAVTGKSITGEVRP